MDPSIEDIKQQTSHDLSDYFQQMSSSEFEGYSMYPNNAQELAALFLSVCANKGTQDILQSFKLNDLNELAEQYMIATEMVSRDDHLTFQVVGIARSLNIPENQLSFICNDFE